MKLKKEGHRLLIFSQVTVQRGSCMYITFRTISFPTPPILKIYIFIVVRCVDD